MESSSKIPDLSDTQPMPGEGHLDGEGSGQVVIPLFTAMGALADEEQTSGPEDEVETASPEQDGVNGGVQIETMDSGPTFKHMDFVSEPIGDKAATELPGIGPATGARLTEQGFGLAVTILGQFLLLRKNEELFVTWLWEVGRANERQAKLCYNCLNQWCDPFL